MHSPSSLVKTIRKNQYTLRRNVGLDEAEEQKEFKTFQKRCEKTIKEQVDRAVTDKVIDDVLLLITKFAEVNANAVGYLTTVWFSFEEVFDELFGEDELDDFYQWAGTQGGQAGLDRLGIELVFLLRNDAVTEYLRDAKNLMIKSVDQTTKEQIVKIIQDGRDGMLTVFEIRQLIEKRFKDISEMRAEMIAQTELANAFNAVDYEVFKRNGVKTVRWVTVLDERVCPICQPLHNVEVSIDGQFAFGGYRPPAHPRCRCFLEEKIEGVSVRDNILVWTGE